MAKICKKCGFNNPDNAHYCGKCGKTLGLFDQYRVYNASLCEAVPKSQLRELKRCKQQIDSSWIYNFRKKLKDWWEDSGKSDTTFWIIFIAVFGTIFVATFFITKSCTSDNKKNSANGAETTMTEIYKESFDDAASMNSFKVIDANGDGAKWKYSDGGMSAYIGNPSGTGHNDWLITPGIKLEAGKSYSFTFNAQTYSSPERLEVKMGFGTTVGDMTTELMHPVEIAAQSKFKSIPIKINVSQSGIYFFGFHALSNSKPDRLDIDNITISAYPTTESDN